jgi:hypothetical protein
MTKYYTSVFYVNLHISKGLKLTYDLFLTPPFQTNQNA